MNIVIIDQDPAGRASLYGTVQMAIRQAQLRRIGIVDVNFESLNQVNTDVVQVCIIGPGCYSIIEKVIERIKTLMPSVKCALIVETHLYEKAVVSVKRAFDIPVMRTGDIGPISAFLIDCDAKIKSGSDDVNKGVIAVTNIAAGAGSTTFTAALGACFARHELSVALVDFSRLNPKLTKVAKVSDNARNIVSDCIKRGHVPVDRLNEIVHPYAGYEGKMVVVGAPISYQERNHFLSDVIVDAPSVSEYVQSLIPILRNEFDIVLIDCGDSWGVATFSCMPLCHDVLLVTDDTGDSVIETLSTLKELAQQSGDPEEFDFAKWSIVINKYTKKAVRMQELAIEVDGYNLFPAGVNIFTLAKSDMGAMWGEPGKTFYEASFSDERSQLIKIATSFIPFKYDENATKAPGLLSRLSK